MAGGRERPDGARREGSELEEPEADDACREEEGEPRGAERANPLAGKRGRGRGQEREKLDRERTSGQNAAVRNRREDRKREEKKE